MRNNATLLVVITGIVCFIIGGSVGYAVRSHTKMTPKEFEHQLTRLNGPETLQLAKVLQQALSKPRETGK